MNFTAPAVKARLKEILEESDDLADEVFVSVGVIEQHPASQVVIGASKTSLRFAGLGTRTPMREDPTQIFLMVRVIRAGEPDYLDVEAEAFAIAGTVEQILRDNPHLKDDAETWAWEFGQVLEAEQSYGVTDDSRLVDIEMTLQGKARHA